MFGSGMKQGGRSRFGTFWHLQASVPKFPQRSIASEAATQASAPSVVSKDRIFAFSVFASLHHILRVLVTDDGGNRASTHAAVYVARFSLSRIQTFHSELSKGILEAARVLAHREHVSTRPWLQPALPLGALLLARGVQRHRRAVAVPE